MTAARQARCRPSASNARPAADVAALARAVRDGDRRALARAITLVELTHRDHRRRADALLRALPPAADTSIRLGISGVPGVGKSTFIEALGLHVIAEGRRVAVLAVDPSSPRTGGSILGDKTRMERLARRSEAFIRPSPAGQALGGVARRTREALLVCEAAGFDVIIVETVGVGQSEFAVADLVDAFVLLLAPGGGDELQGIKKGIMELADLVVITKADGDLAAPAARAEVAYAGALRMLSPPPAAWVPPVLKCSALSGEGIAEVWSAVDRFRETMERSGGFIERRRRQALNWMWNEIQETMLERLRANPGIARRLRALEAKVAAGALPPHEAAGLALSGMFDARRR